MIKVSVVIPIYNVEKYLQETLDCFVNQTLDNIEIICVDDGSTDGSAEIIKEYMEKDERVHLIMQENKGAGVARNTGMAKAKGEYLYFFDGDDYCEHCFLENVAKMADDTKADIVVFDYYRVDQITKKETLYKGMNKKLLPAGTETFNYKDVPDRILSIVNPTPWNKLYNRNFVLSTKLQFMELSTTNDITFAALSVAMADKIVYDETPYMYYRTNRDLALTSFKQKRMDNVLKAVEGVVSRAKELEYSESIKCSIVYFSASNLIFALENYAGKFSNKHYRRYYQKIHKIFNEEDYKKVDKIRFGNNKAYSKFAAIRRNSYLRAFAKKVKIKILGKGKKKSDIAIAKLSKQNHVIAIRQNNTTATIKKLQNEIKELERLIKYSNQSGVTTSKRNPQIIVSLTTFPKRIYTVITAIESIMCQTVKADKIVLWLAKENFPQGERTLPERLLQLKERGLEILWCDIDYRSYKKIIPTLSEFPNDIIITIDDDLIYDEQLIERLYDSYKSNPNSISAARVHRITFAGDVIAPYEKWTKEDGRKVGEPRFDLLATTGAGTLFPAHILPEETKNWEVIGEMCPCADDIWIKIMATINDVPVVAIQENQKIQYIANSQEESLWSVNITQNDVQLKKLLAHYNEENIVKKMTSDS